MVNSKVKKGERNKRGCNFFQKKRKGGYNKGDQFARPRPKTFLSHARRRGASVSHVRP